MISVTRTGAGDAIGIVTIERPERRNALNGQVIEELTRAFENLREDATCRVVILTGSGGFFSAGADLATFDGIGEETDHNRTLRSLAAGGRLCHVIENMPQITISAIEGGAIGGGLGMAVSCDWRVMAANSFAYVPEVKLGLNYGWNTLPRLTRLVGPARAKTIAVLCRRHDAAECQAWGLADVVTPADGALEGALALAAEVSGLPRMAAQTVKRQVNSYATALGQNVSFADMELMMVCLNDAEGAQARAAFTRPKSQGGRT
ncbi:MAG: enoyl-CoA hydratase/isomerase family protein [Mesorhizobium sp.]